MKYGTTMQIGTVLRLRFCRRSRRFEINLRWNSVHFSEVTRSCQEVGHARNRLQFHTVLRKLKYFLSMQVHAWMEFQLLIFGFCNRSAIAQNRVERGQVSRARQELTGASLAPRNEDTMQEFQDPKKGGKKFPRKFWNSSQKAS